MATEQARHELRQAWRRTKTGTWRAWTDRQGEPINQSKGAEQSKGRAARRVVLREMRAASTGRRAAGGYKGKGRATSKGRQAARGCKGRAALRERRATSK